jgi:hypothetical protein
VWRFISEDGAVEFTYPRTDLVKPTVKVLVSGDVYTYVVTNGPDAKANIDMIGFAPFGHETSEVFTQKGFMFAPSAWMSELAAGIAPGHAAIFKVRQKQFHSEMTFMNSQGMIPELPDDTPLGLIVLFTDWMRAHDRVKISGIEPVLPAPK